jgi:adenylate kinase family enzyme
MKTLVISGPPCSGKTFLINRLKKDHNVLIENGFLPPYSFVSANEIRKKHFTDNTMIIHYDCLRSFKRRTEVSIDSDCFLEFLSSRENLSIAFLSSPTKILLSRIHKRQIRLKNVIETSRKEKLERLISLYKNETQLLKEYIKWYDFVMNQTGHEDLFIVDGEKQNFTKFTHIKSSRIFFMDQIMKLYIERT